MIYVLRGIRPMKNLTRVVLTTCLIFCFSGNRAAAHEKNRVEKPDATQMSFVKPGAAVTLDHDYDGQTKRGELEAVNMTIDHLYDSGVLTVRFLPSVGLDILSDMRPQIAPLSVGSSLPLYVQFSAQNTGVYNLGVECVYDDGLGQQSRRTLSVPIYVGAVSTQKSSVSDGNMQRKAKLDGLVILPAQESIR